MTWCLILSFYFLYSVTGSLVPEDHVQQPGDIHNNLTSNVTEDTIESKVQDVTEIKSSLNIAKNKDCFTSTDMTRTIIVILESVKRNPEILNDLIETLNSEIKHGSQISKNNTKSDNRRAFLLQLKLPNKHSANQLPRQPQCVRAITHLADIAHRAYMNLKRIPTCMKLIFPNDKVNDHLEVHEKNTAPDMNMMLALILKELERYIDRDISKKRKPEKTNNIAPEFYLHDWNITKPSMYQNVNKIDTINNQSNPILDSATLQESDLTQNDPMSTFILKPLVQPDNPIESMKHSNYVTLAVPGYKILETLPKPSPVSKPQPKLPLFQPNMFVQESRPILEPELVGNPLENLIMSETLEPPVLGVPDAFPNDNVLETDPKVLEQAHVPISGAPQIIFSGNFDEPIHFLHGTTFVGNEKPFHVENIPTQNNAVPYFFDYTTKKPFYMNMNSMLPSANIEKLKLPQYTINPSNNQLENFKIVHENHDLFETKLKNILIALLHSYQNGLIDSKKIFEIYNFLLQPETNTLLNEENRNIFWNLLKPDETGQINTSNIDTVLSLVHTIGQGSNSIKNPDQLVSTSKEEEQRDREQVGITYTLVNQNKQKLLAPEQEKILLLLMDSNRNDQDYHKYLNIAKLLANWDHIPYLNSENVNMIFSLLKPNNEGVLDPRAVDIIQTILLLKQRNLLTTEDFNILLSYSNTDANGITKSKRLDIVYFILNDMKEAPNFRNAFIQLLDADKNSKYIDLLLSLYKEHILSIQLLDAFITLLKQENAGYIDNFVLNKILILLAPYKIVYPKIITDIFKQLRTTRSPNYPLTLIGLNSNTVPVSNNIMKPWLFNSPVVDTNQQDFEIPNNSTSNNNNNEKANNMITEHNTLHPNMMPKILQMPPREHSGYANLLDKYGFIELTYLINKIPVYKPMYYVKYKIPMSIYLKILNYQNDQNPQLRGNPRDLLQKLILEENMSEVSPSLASLKKEDLLKLTFSDGNLVQAKLLQEKSSNLNEDIKMLHNLNINVSPEEILQQNNKNSAQFFGSTRGNIGGLSNSVNLREVHGTGYNTHYPPMIVNRPVGSYF